MLQHCRYRNQDGEAVASDTALFSRNTAACPNKLKPNYTPGTPAPTVPALPTKPILPNVLPAGTTGNAGLPTLPANVAKNINNASAAITNQVDQVVNR